MSFDIREELSKANYGKFEIPWQISKQHLKEKEKRKRKNNQTCDLPRTMQSLPLWCIHCLLVLFVVYKVTLKLIFIKLDQLCRFYFPQEIFSSSLLRFKFNDSLLELLSQTRLFTKAFAGSPLRYPKLDFKKYAVLPLECSAYYTLIIFHKVLPGTIRSKLNTQDLWLKGNHSLRGSTNWEITKWLVVPTPIPLNRQMSLKWKIRPQKDMPSMNNGNQILPLPSAILWAPDHHFLFLDLSFIIHEVDEIWIRWCRGPFNL